MSGCGQCGQCGGRALTVFPIPAGHTGDGGWFTSQARSLSFVEYNMYVCTDSFRRVIVYSHIVHRGKNKKTECVSNKG